MQISPLSGWLVSALSISIGENDSFPLLTLTLTTITSMQIQNKQASSRPLHVHTTMQPPSKITVCKCTVLVSIPTCICEIKIKKSGIGHQIFKKKIAKLCMYWLENKSFARWATVVRSTVAPREQKYQRRPQFFVNVGSDSTPHTSAG